MLFVTEFVLRRSPGAGVSVRRPEASLKGLHLIRSVRHAHAPRPRQQVARASGDNGANQTTGSNGGPPQKAPVNPWAGVEMINDTDTKFVLKLLVVSFAGAAAVKYGSLLSSVPFSPDPTLAITVVLGPPILYSLYILVRGHPGI
eukprot:jgi/Botrbrau1/10065/Bobra.0355s0020.1